MVVTSSEFINGDLLLLSASLWCIPRRSAHSELPEDGPRMACRWSCKAANCITHLSDHSQWTAGTAVQHIYASEQNCDSYTAKNGEIVCDAALRGLGVMVAHPTPDRGVGSSSLSDLTV